MSLKCENKKCKMHGKSVYQLHYESASKDWRCEHCRYVPQQFQAFHGIETIYHEGIGNVSKARCREIERRVVVAYNKDGSCHVGRMGENGKIQDRKVDIRP